MAPDGGATHQPVFLELIGPAGAGKSTLSRVLARRESVTRTSIWETPESHLALDSIRTIPTLAAISMRARALLWQEFKLVVRVRDLQRRMNRMDGRLVVLDEGPVYTVTWLLVSGHRSIREGRLEKWWQRTLADWASHLDVIVVLDAADELLGERIRSRAKPHNVKHKSDAEIYAFLDRFRTAFDRVLTEVVREHGTRVLRLAGDCESQRLADNLVKELGGDCRGD